MGAVGKKLKLGLRSLLARKVSDPGEERYVQRVSRRWEKGVDGELTFWERWSQGAVFPGSLEERLVRGRPLQDYVTRWLDPASRSARILDVGAGPITLLGTSWPGHEVELVAVDALGEAYADMLAKNGIDAPVATLACPTERLHELFEEASFDLVHAKNTLDHHADVLGAIRQMIRATRPGGHVVMRHAEDEGARRSYRGLHQWNFRVEGDDFVIWNLEARTSLRQQLAGVAEVVELDNESTSGDGRSAHVVLRKT